MCAPQVSGRQKYYVVPVTDGLKIILVVDEQFLGVATGWRPPILIIKWSYVSG